MEAVKSDSDWKLAFPVTEKEVKEDKLDLTDSQKNSLEKLACKRKISD